MHIIGILIFFAQSKYCPSIPLELFETTKRGFVYKKKSLIAKNFFLFSEILNSSCFILWFKIFVKLNMKTLIGDIGNTDIKLCIVNENFKILKKINLNTLNVKKDINFKNKINFLIKKRKINNIKRS